MDNKKGNISFSSKASKKSKQQQMLSPLPPFPSSSLYSPMSSTTPENRLRSRSPTARAGRLQSPHHLVGMQFRLCASNPISKGHAVDAPNHGFSQALNPNIKRVVALLDQNTMKRVSFVGAGKRHHPPSMLQYSDRCLPDTIQELSSSNL